ncbi:aminotransferase class I/II-fold pyridoxal phosphate-dependent enzyme [Streptomyces sp. SLBN-115]|uniref:aminotransferase class I/II-fold pyridoxal phosphate-dependent enzyme n=1 Tax=Streptomyces sp. SLBN-115 TaxID=2768453 RepID=UPI003FCC6F99
MACQLLADDSGFADVLADRRARLRAQRDHLAHRLDGTGWTYELPHGGLTLWLHLGTATRAADLATRAAARGLVVIPGPHFAVRRTDAKFTVSSQPGPDYNRCPRRAV